MTMSLSWMAVSSPQKNTMDGSAIQRLGNMVGTWVHPLQQSVMG
jgi:hypothetical protein